MTIFTNPNMEIFNNDMTLVNGDMITIGDDENNVTLPRWAVSQAFVHHALSWRGMLAIVEDCLESEQVSESDVFKHHLLPEFFDDGDKTVTIVIGDSYIDCEEYPETTIVVDGDWLYDVVRPQLF